MALKHRIILLTAIVFSAFACSDGISKREQEQFIRKEYPLRRHAALWKDKTSTCKQLLESSIGYIDNSSPYYYFFWEYWHALHKSGADKIFIERVDSLDSDQFKPEYREYMKGAINNLFIDMDAASIKPEYSNIELLVMQFQSALNFISVYDSDEEINYLFDYLYGHCKATTPIPVITGMEYIKNGSNGMPYWRVHFDDGVSHNVRVFTNDAGIMDLERLRLPM